MNSVYKLLKPCHRKKSISLLFFFLFVICTAQGQAEAQPPKVAIHVSNPLTLFIKTGLKLEYRNKQMGYLLMGKRYYGGSPSGYDPFFREIGEIFGQSTWPFWIMANMI